MDVFGNLNVLILRIESCIKNSMISEITPTHTHTHLFDRLDSNPGGQLCWSQISSRPWSTQTLSAPVRLRPVLWSRMFLLWLSVWWNISIIYVTSWIHWEPLRFLWVIPDSTALDQSAASPLSVHLSIIDWFLLWLIRCHRRVYS